ncbi:hypothetical protein VIGAN_01199000, partial [Vigna angularis var. angularis]
MLKQNQQQPDMTELAKGLPSYWHHSQLDPSDVLHLKQTELSAFLEGLYATPTNRINTLSIPVITPNPIEDNKIEDILRKLVDPSCQRYLSKHCNSSL